MDHDDPGHWDVSQLECCAHPWSPVKVSVCKSSLSGEKLGIDGGRDGAMDPWKGGGGWMCGEMD